MYRSSCHTSGACLACFRSRLFGAFLLLFFFRRENKRGGSRDAVASPAACEFEVTFVAAAASDHKFAKKAEALLVIARSGSLCARRRNLDRFSNFWCHLSVSSSSNAIHLQCFAGVYLLWLCSRRNRLFRQAGKESTNSIYISNTARGTQEVSITVCPPRRSSPPLTHTDTGTIRSPSMKSDSQAALCLFKLGRSAEALRLAESALTTSCSLDAQRFQLRGLILHDLRRYAEAAKVCAEHVDTTTTRSTKPATSSGCDGEILAGISRASKVGRVTGSESLVFTDTEAHERDCAQRQVL